MRDVSVSRKTRARWSDELCKKLIPFKMQSAIAHLEVKYFLLRDLSKYNNTSSGHRKNNQRHVTSAKYCRRNF